MRLSPTAPPGNSGETSLSLPPNITFANEQLLFTISHRPQSDRLGLIDCSITAERIVCNSRTLRLREITGLAEHSQEAIQLLHFTREIALANHWGLLLSDRLDDETRRWLEETGFEEHFRVEPSQGI